MLNHDNNTNKNTRLNNHQSNSMRINSIYLGTCRKTYLNKIFVRNYYTTSVLSNIKLLTSTDLKMLKTLWNKERIKGKVTNVMETLQHPLFLKLSYKLVRLKMRILNFSVMGTAAINLISHDWFEKLSIRLRNGNFRFIALNTYCAKTVSTNNITKLLQFSSLRNAVVSQAIELILEFVYEPIFLSISHGFRPTKGYHSALRQIKLYWTDLTWVINFSVVFTQTLNGNRMNALLSQRIADNLFFQLITNFLLYTNNNSTKLPVDCINPKNEMILKPILFNIYLHELDLKFAKPQQNIVASRIQNRAHAVRTKSQINVFSNSRNSNFRILSLLKYGQVLAYKNFTKGKKRNQVRFRNSINNNKVALYYVRYLTLIVVGVKGCSQLARKISKHIVTFCNSNLKLLLTVQRAKDITFSPIKLFNFEIGYVQQSLNNSVKLRQNKKIRNTQILFLQQQRTTCSPKRFVKQSFKFNFDSLLDRENKVVKNITSSFSFVPNRNDYYSSQLPKTQKKIFIRVSDKNLTENLIQNTSLNRENSKVIPLLLRYSNFLIIKWFNIKAKFLLKLYCCCQNFNTIKIFIDRMWRYCALKTLATKNKLTIKKTLKIWSRNLIIYDKTGTTVLTQFLAKSYIMRQKRMFIEDVNLIEF